MTTCKIQEISPLNTQLPLQVIQDHEVKWNIIYDLLYAFHVNVGHNMPDSVP